MAELLDEIVVEGRRFQENLARLLGSGSVGDLVPVESPLESRAAADAGQEAIARGEAALANVYTERFLDTAQAEIDEAARRALERGGTPAEVARALGNYEIAGIRIGVNRAGDAVARVMATFVPEVVVTASRVASSTPAGLAAGIVEGAYWLGSYLSDLALRNAVRRITGPAPAADTASEPPPPVGPTSAVPEDWLLPPVDVTATRPQDRPFSPVAPVLTTPTSLRTPFDDVWLTPEPARPVGTSTPQSFANPLTVPNPFIDPLTFANPFPSPSSPSSPRPTSTPDPFDAPSPFASPMPGPGSGNPFSPPPESKDPCNCGQKPKPKKKKKPRTKCYKGTYYEGVQSLTKYPKEEIPCQPSKLKRR